MDSYSTWPFEADFFHLANSFKSQTCVACVSAFLWLHNIPPYGYTSLLISWWILICFSWCCQLMDIWVVSALCIEIQILYHICDLQVFFFPFGVLSFYFLDGIISSIKFFDFDVVILYIFFFCYLPFGIVSTKLVPNLWSWRHTPYVFLWEFYGMFMIHLFVFTSELLWTLSTLEKNGQKWSSS